MVQLTLIFVLGIIFWVGVFKARSKLMDWVVASEQKDIGTNDRVRELAWWAAIGVISVFLTVADLLAKAVILLL